MNLENYQTALLIKVDETSKYISPYNGKLITRHIDKNDIDGVDKNTIDVPSNFDYTQSKETSFGCKYKLIIIPHESASLCCIILLGLNISKKLIIDRIQNISNDNNLIVMADIYDESMLYPTSNERFIFGIYIKMSILFFYDMKLNEIVYTQCVQDLDLKYWLSISNLSSCAKELSPGIAQIMNGYANSYTLTYGFVSTPTGEVPFACIDKIEMEYLRFFANGNYAVIIYMGDGNVPIMELHSVANMKKFVCLSKKIDTISLVLSNDEDNDCGSVCNILGVVMSTVYIKLSYFDGTKKLIFAWNINLHNLEKSEKLSLSNSYKEIYTIYEIVDYYIMSDNGLLAIKTDENTVIILDLIRGHTLLKYNPKGHIENVFWRPACLSTMEYNNIKYFVGNMLPHCDNIIDIIIHYFVEW